jgi:hypothetical protein
MVDVEAPESKEAGLQSPWGHQLMDFYVVIYAAVATADRQLIVSGSRWTGLVQSCVHVCLKQMRCQFFKVL